MISVIIAGGSGTRLWPLSTNSYPKQLLKLTDDRSLLQGTYERAKLFSDHIYFVPEIRLAELIHEQLPDVPLESIIMEPGLRGTAHCFVAALDAISRKHDWDEPIAFLWSDHHVRDTSEYSRSFKIAARSAIAQKRIAMVGIKPTYPATGFGYIEKSDLLDTDSDVYEVACFKEKPNFDDAQGYVASGRFLWNAGYLVGSINIFIDTMKRDAPELYAAYKRLHAINGIDSDEYKDAYLSLNNETIDYALTEKVQDLLVVPAAFDWLDVGSFKDLHLANFLDDDHNHIYGKEIYVDGVENSYIRNDTDKPIAVIGLDNIVVVNTPNGVLVARKDLSQNVGDIAKKIQS